MGVFHHRVFYPRPRSGSVGRVALSREDKEAAKLGLSVFTVITPKYAGSHGGVGIVLSASSS